MLKATKGKYEADGLHQCIFVLKCSTTKNVIKSILALVSNTLRNKEMCVFNGLTLLLNLIQYCNNQ